MSITINGTTGIAGVDGSAATPAFQGNDTNTGIFYPAADTIAFAEGGTEVMRIDSSGNVGIGTSSPGVKLDVIGSIRASDNVYTLNGAAYGWGSLAAYVGGSSSSNFINFVTGSTERMRIDSSGNLLVGTTSTSPATGTTAGTMIGSGGELQVGRGSNTPVYFNRITNDGTIVSLRQDGNEEGTISVSGTTVSYNGGHLSRWSQWQNETGKPSIYRGTVLESTNDMCEWEKDGEPLPNEQATKTIVSATVASKAVAGVFDRYDEDDETNPYDFYVAQSGDFVIRIAQGVTVQNGDLLESAGDGTAKPQVDDICRSSTIAKVTSNYVSATYEDGSYCVPCILMIG